MGDLLKAPVILTVFTIFLLIYGAIAASVPSQRNNYGDKNARKNEMNLINRKLIEKIASLQKAGVGNEKMKAEIASYLITLAEEFGAESELHERLTGASKNQVKPRFTTTTKPDRRWSVSRTSTTTPNPIDNIEDIIFAALEVAQEEVTTRRPIRLRPRRTTEKPPDHEEIIFNHINEIFNNVGEGDIIGVVDESIKFAHPNTAIKVANGIMNSLFCLNPFSGCHNSRT